MTRLELFLDGPHNGDYVRVPRNADVALASGTVYYRNAWPTGEVVWTTYPPEENDAQARSVEAML